MNTTDPGLYRAEQRLDSVVAKMAIEFIPTDNGTQIDYRLEVGFKGLLRLIEPFMKPALTKQYRTALNALGDYIQASD
jgi:hypothetical protein